VFDRPVLREEKAMYTYREVKNLQAYPRVQTPTAVWQSYCNDEQLA
jgi:hypothetical protein